MRSPIENDIIAVVAVDEQVKAAAAFEEIITRARVERLIPAHRTDIVIAVDGIGVVGGVDKDIVAAVDDVRGAVGVDGRIIGDVIYIDGVIKGECSIADINARLLEPVTIADEQVGIDGGLRGAAVADGVRIDGREHAAVVGSEQ